MKKFTPYIAILSLFFSLFTSSAQASQSLSISDLKSNSVTLIASSQQPTTLLNFVITDTVSKTELASKDMMTDQNGYAQASFSGLAINGHYTGGIRIRYSAFKTGPWLDILPFSTPFDLINLNATIKLAQDKLGSAVEGEKVGQYKNGSKALLQQAIEEANLINKSPDSFTTAKQADVDNMVTKLQKAMADFDASKISTVNCPTGQTWDATINACVLGTVTIIGDTSGNMPKGDTSANIPSNNKGINTNIGGIENPLGKNGPQDIPSFIELLLNIVLVIGVPLVTLAIIYAGFKFVTAQGNSEKLGEAKKILLYTIIGATLLLGSFVIAKAIKGTVDEIKKTS